MLTIYRSEGSASLRRVPIWLVGSTGTAPATGEAAGQPQITWHARGTATVNTTGTLSLVSANAGLYHVELTASEVSCLGIFSVHFRSATAIAQAVFGKVVNYDSGDSIRFGQLALPNAAAEASGGLLTFGTGTGQIHTSTGSVGLKEITYSGVTILGVQRADVGYISGDAAAADNLELAFDGTGYSSAMTVVGVTRLDSSVTLRAVTHSGATIKGIENYANISNVTLHVGIHSGATVAINDIAAGTYSSVTLQGLSNYANLPTVTLAAGTHSGATIQGISNYANISNVTLAAGTHSNVTIKGIENYANISSVTLNVGSHSGATIDGVRIIATPGERSIASSLLSTNIGSNRLIQEAFFVLRNRVQISGSTGTVFHPDDATSAWTFSVTTGTDPLSGIDPGGV